MSRESKNLRSHQQSSTLFLKFAVFQFLEQDHFVEHYLLPATIPAMSFIGDPSDAITREEARVARLEKELEESRAALESLRTVLAAAGRSSPPTAPALIPSSTAPVTSSEKVALFRSLFRGREDVYPKLWTNVKTGRKGYAPAR